LFRMDPVGIAVDNPHTDEYASEAAMIARFLPEAKDTEDLERAVREVFLRQFGEPLLDRSPNIATSPSRSGDSPRKFEKPAARPRSPSRRRVAMNHEDGCMRRLFWPLRVRTVASRREGHAPPRA